MFIKFLPFASTLGPSFFVARLPVRLIQLDPTKPQVSFSKSQNVKFAERNVH